MSNVRATNLLAANSNRARARFDLGHRAPHGVNWQNLGSGDVARLSSTTERGKEGGREGDGDGMGIMAVAVKTVGPNRGLDIGEGR